MTRLATVITAIALIGTPAFAADMAAKAPPPPPAPIYNWTGFYFGVNAGWSWGKADTTINVPSPGAPFIPATFNDTTHPEGAIGGAQIGYNWQSTPNWVLGVEADIQASGENASITPQGHFIGLLIAGPTTITFSDSIPHRDAINWFGTVRGRVGYEFWPTTMFYATGGFAYGGVANSFSNNITATVCTVGVGCASGTANNSNLDGTSTKTGWTAGAGFEGFTQDRRVTWKAEYLYLDLGTANYSWFDPSLLVTITASSKFTDHIFRVGLNWHLN
jgi:outer membrane immunogenic protein